jgi:ABC-type enterochelin transport system ATPase subunit
MDKLYKTTVVIYSDQNFESAGLNALLSDINTGSVMEQVSFEEVVNSNLSQDILNFFDEKEQRQIVFDVLNDNPELDYNPYSDDEYEFYDD